MSRGLSLLKERQVFILIERRVAQADEQEMERHRSAAMSDLMRRSLDGSMLRRAPLQDGDDMFYDAVDGGSRHRFAENEAHHRL